MHAIQVYGEGTTIGEESGVIATFTTAKCKHKKGSEGPYFSADATSTDGKSVLHVSIPAFAGFKTEYELEQASQYPKPFVTFQATGGGPLYSSAYAPPYETPGFGEVIFREAGHLMGVGYGPAMFDYHGDSAVFFTGVVECETGKKGKTGGGGGGKKGKPGKKPGKA